MSDEEDTVECCEHGKSQATFVCSHLINQENIDWYSAEPDRDDPYPDAWCGICNVHFENEGEWNEEAEAASDASNTIKILCAKCYEQWRLKCNVHYL